MTEANWRAILVSWEWNPWVAAWLILGSLLYLRGWLTIRRRCFGQRCFGQRCFGWRFVGWRFNEASDNGSSDNGASRDHSLDDPSANRVSHGRFGWGRLACFQLGLATIYLAIQSPLDSLSAFSLQAHMIQHLLLLIMAPVLILFGAPMVPMIAGLPASVRRNWFVPFATWPPLRSALARLFHPVATWIIFVVVLWGWHAPQAYELALNSRSWHRAEHACFLISGLLLWFTVIRPYPFRPKWSNWWLVPFLFLAGIQGTAISGILTFAERVLYPHYEQIPNLFGQSALADQSMAGAIMWVPMAIAFLIALVLCVGELFVGSDSQSPKVSPLVRPIRTQSKDAQSKDTQRMGARYISAKRKATSGLAKLGSLSTGRRETVGLDRVLRLPWVRRSLQFALLLATVCVIADGLLGPQVASLNLAGVLPWIHWRGLLVIALVLGGNFFCMVCPFTTLSRMAGSRWFGWFGKGGKRSLRWPSALRNKWLAIGLLVVFFWAYEAFALWDRPLATAWIAIVFFGFAMLTKVVFRDAPFCKYVCPIGQFNFVQSLFSPTEIAAVSSQPCSTCTTKDCIAGNDSSPGCGLRLYLPNKVGNMDCTFCYDCADACPHDNVALVAIDRGTDLAFSSDRSGVGCFSQRLDIAVLIALLFFAALANAAWMTGPFLQLEDNAVDFFGVGRLPVVTIGMLIVLVALPAALLYAVTAISNRLSVDDPLPLDQQNRFSPLVHQFARRVPMLVPLGLGMWLAHYTFHLVTTWDAAGTAAHRAINQLGGRAFDVDPGPCACCLADSISWLLPLEFCFLAAGLCGSLVVLHRIIRTDIAAGFDALRASLPWGVLLIAYYACCLWVLLQPMQMRGA